MYMLAVYNLHLLKINVLAEPVQNTQNSVNKTIKTKVINSKLEGELE